MTRERPRIGVIGATGAVGEELLRALAQRRFPLSELVPFASELSVGLEIDFQDEGYRVQEPDPPAVTACDLVFCAASEALPPLLPALRERGTLGVDLSGALELDPEVPLYRPGLEPQGPWLAVPRGVVWGLVAALGPLAREARLERITVTTLEPASGAGRSGLEELQGQTVRLLQAMDGELEASSVFPGTLAFDCLPLVGDLEGSDESTEERRLRHVLRRAMGLPGLRIEPTRIRVPVFLGALASVRVELAKGVDPGRVRELWDAAPGLQVLPSGTLPTARAAVASDDMLLGRLRFGDEGRDLGFVLALDPLRRGAALPALEAAARLLAA